MACGTRARTALLIVGLASAHSLLAHQQPAGSSVDPLSTSRGTWGQAYEDQWGLRRIGLDTAAARPAGSPVVVALIDSGLDFFHPDLASSTVWRNTREIINGVDDDKNGYVDDAIGWNFIDNTNDVWDTTGHGTHVAGIIAAATGNGEGIAGINPAAVIMPLKALNVVGRGRSSGIAAAIYYAVEQGARVINLSLGGARISQVETKAVEYAARRGVLVVVAAGNDGVDVSSYGFAALPNVLAVAATDATDRRAGFSNRGARIAVAAPGVDILSLRARFTDFMRLASPGEYTAESGFVGPENRYYRASGTSFAAPFVSGVASMILAARPGLTAVQIGRMIVQSAADIEAPGVDDYTGYGRLDARAALTADPEFYLDARIDGVQVVRVGNGTALRVLGTAGANRFGRRWIEIGRGESPASFERVTPEANAQVASATLADLDAGRLKGSNQWVLRLIVTHENGRRREARFDLTLQ